MVVRKLIRYSVFFILLVITGFGYLYAYDTNELYLEELIQEIENNVEYSYSRRYVMYVIDKFLLANTNIIDKIDIHYNELFYIQIEDREDGEVSEMRISDFEEAIVHSDRYYKAITKPYSYIYLGFYPINNKDFGYTTYHYFLDIKDKEQRSAKYESMFDEINSKANNIFTMPNGEQVKLNNIWTDADISLDDIGENRSIYELRHIEPIGIFYRKISIDYLYEYITVNTEKYPDSYENTKKQFILDLIDYLGSDEENRFKPTGFILDDYIGRG